MNRRTNAVLTLLSYLLTAVGGALAWDFLTNTSTPPTVEHHDPTPPPAEPGQIRSA